MVGSAMPSTAGATEADDGLWIAEGVVLSGADEVICGDSCFCSATCSLTGASSACINKDTLSSAMKNFTYD